MKTKLVLSLALAAGLAACGKGRTQTWERTGAATASTTASAGITAEGDAFWEKRDEKANVEAALKAWDAALATDPRNLDLLVRLSRGTYFLADGYLRADKDAYLAAFEKGVDYAERALVSSSAEFEKKVKDGEAVKDAVSAVGAEGVPALYWYSSNLGKWAKAKGFTTTLGNKDTIKAVMGRCLELDENFFYGGPHRYFGTFYSVAPSFAGGDTTVSKTHFDKSLTIAPNYLATKVLMAENYAPKMQDKELYKKLLEEVLAAPDDGIPELVPESKIEKQKAKELLSQIDEKF